MKHIKMGEYLLKEYLTLIFLMGICRGLFIFFNREGTAGIPKSIIGKSFLYGWIFDNSVTCYYIGILLIFLLIYSFLRVIWLGIIGKIIVNIYKIFVSSIIFFILLSDIEYYRAFNFHLNATIFDYTDHMDEIGNTVLYGDYNIFSILLIFIIIEGIYLYISLKAFNNDVYKDREKGITFFNDIGTIFLVGILSVFGARGGFSQSTLNWGRAYFSKYSFANQTAINGVFALGKSMDLARKDRRNGKSNISKIFTSKELKNNMREYIGTEKDNFISDKNILLRETKTGKEVKNYNVVIVLMESFMGDTVGALGGSPDLTPNYNKLAEEGVLFTNFFSNGNRSNRGILSVLTGFPSQYGKSILKKPVGQKPFVSLAQILKERGYSAHFMYGGDIEFDNMKGFFETNGITNFVSRDNFSKKERTIKWGVPDDKLFDRAAEYLGTLKQPFFFEVFTLSNHAPFDIDENFKEFTEEDYPDYERYNAFKFADYSIGRFVNAVKDKEWAKNTIFVFVADHGENRRKAIEIDWKKFSNPLVIWTPGGQLKHEIIDKAGSQLDLLPTIMGLLGGDYIHSAWGKDLLSEENKDGFAYVVENNFIGIIDKENIYIDGINIEGVLRKKSDDSIIEDRELTEKYKKAARTYLELSIQQEKNGTFGK
ncbi:sulfatase-like hydrolase/transferase [Fusobacterium perfoetens]|uniref:LTA synthase family protein n=1 Tax=Fusobacterium perfoetens TaxID=852 RepID=UPI001F1CAD89|nr:LTA synthase family protein [Fusobacterium perfoetens]MCF2624910.1 sulfatase-like hydrolase/transferase [Fusobacterium perfoetens]